MLFNEIYIVYITLLTQTRRINNIKNNSKENEDLKIDTWFKNRTLRIQIKTLKIDYKVIWITQFRIKSCIKMCYCFEVFENNIFCEWRQREIKKCYSKNQ